MAGVDLVNKHKFHGTVEVIPDPGVDVVDGPFALFVRLSGCQPGDGSAFGSAGDRCRPGG